MRLRRIAISVVLAWLASVTAFAQVPDVVVTGTIEAQDAMVVLVAPGRTTGRVQVKGTWAATLTFESTVDAVEWLPVQALNIETNAVTTSTTTPGIYTLSLVAYRSVRVRASTYTSGSATVTWRASGTGGNALIWVANGASGGGGGGDVNVTNSSLAVTGPLTNSELRASAVPVTDNGGSLTVDGTVSVGGSVAVTGPLTDAQLRATAVPVSGTFWPVTQPVSGTVAATGPLTDTELRASPVPVSGTVAVSGTLPVSGPLTDAQLRASSVAVVGPLTDAQLRAAAVPVSGPLTDQQLRATAVPVSGTFWQATQPVSGSVTVSQATGTNLHVVVDSAPSTAVTGTFWQATQPVSAVSLPLPTGAATAAKQPALGTAGSASADVLTVQGIASMTALKVDGSAVTQPVSGTFWQATQPVSIASMPATPVTDNGGSLTVDGTVGVSGTVTVATHDVGNISTSVTPGTAAANLGKAEDAAHTSADVGVMNLGVRSDSSSTALTSAAGDYSPYAVDAYGTQYTRNDSPNRFSCSLDAIAATLTQCQGAPAAGLSLYLTGYTAGSTTTTAGQHLLRYGTGSNCGTGTTTLFPGTGTTARVPSPANTVAPTMITFTTPIKVPAANALCVIGVATNTTWIVVHGFTAPQ